MADPAHNAGHAPFGRGAADKLTAGAGGVLALGAFAGLAWLVVNPPTQAADPAKAGAGAGAVPAGADGKTATPAGGAPATGTGVVAGDPALGLVIFTNGKGLNCIGCHSLNLSDKAGPKLSEMFGAADRWIPAGGGGKVGPNLSGIALRFKPDELRAKILNPSTKIREDYRVTQILTDEDDAIAGIVREETAKEVKLVTATGEIKTVAKDVIATRKFAEKSLMPDGMGGRMTPAEMEHLLAFLATLKDASVDVKPAGEAKKAG